MQFLQDCPDDKQPPRGHQKNKKNLLELSFDIMQVAVVPKVLIIFKILLAQGAGIDRLAFRVALLIMLPEEILFDELLIAFPAENGVSHPIIDLRARITGKIII